MRKIQLKDVIDIAEYERQRPEFRPRIMEIKKPRRIHVGPFITYLFENFDTMLYQVQEMMRAERIVMEEAIQEEIDTYNELIPDTNQLCASMFIEIDDKNQRMDFLTKTVDLPQHTYLKVNAEKIPATFDPRQGSEDKLSSVQYVKFSLTAEQAAAFGKPGSTTALGFDHALYKHEYQLTDSQKQALFGDMSQ